MPACRGSLLGTNISENSIFIKVNMKWKEGKKTGKKSRINNKEIAGKISILPNLAFGIYRKKAMESKNTRGHALHIQFNRIERAHTTCITNTPFWHQIYVDGFFFPLQTPRTKQSMGTLTASTMNKSNNKFAFISALNLALALSLSPERALILNDSWWRNRVETILLKTLTTPSKCLPFMCLYSHKAYAESRNGESERERKSKLRYVYIYTRYNEIACKTYTRRKNYM